MFIALIIIALLIISVLAFYAGTLLFKLNVQSKTKQATTNKRIATISESIQTIAKAVEQEQCNLSEASIRLYHLLEGLPVLEKPEFANQYPGIFELYEGVKALPTHQARQSQSKLETRKQDIQREQLEAKLATKIQSEIKQLTTFSI